VTEEEWLNHSQTKVKKKNTTYNEAQVKKTFKRIDKGSNGLISPEELSKIIKK
jgi:Ca2+-binding EF-hand superfamily protein